LQHGLDDPCECGHIRGDHRPTDSADGTVLNQRHERVVVSSGVVCGGACGRVDCSCGRYTRKG
jgi:hypothetical protein